jgi:hypothetical protein
LETDFASLKEVYDKIVDISPDWELYTFKSWKSKTGEDILTIRLKRKPKQVKPDAMKIIKV